jgi:hypothetical protein
MQEKLAWVEKLIAEGRKEHALSLLKLLVFENPENEVLQEKLAALVRELAPAPPPLPASPTIPKAKNVPLPPPLPDSSITLPKSDNTAKKVPQPPPLPSPSLVLPKIEHAEPEKPAPSTPILPDGGQPPLKPATNSSPPAPPLPSASFNFEVRKTRKPKSDDKS